LVKKVFIGVFLILAVFSVGLTVYKETHHHYESFTRDHLNSDMPNAKKAPEHSAVPSNGQNESVVVRRDVGIDIGNIAPDFTLPTIDRQDVRLSSLRGKKIILNFWATWCPPCREEMPDLEAFYSEHAKEKNVVVLAVNLTSAEASVGDVKKFIKKYNLTFPVLLAKSDKLAAQYQAFTIPTSYIIDSNGVIRNKRIGPMDQKWMSEQIDAIR